MRKIITLIIITILAALLTACSNSIAQLTSSQLELQSSVSTQTAVQSQAASAQATASSHPASLSPKSNSTAESTSSPDTILDDINASLTKLGGTVDQLETVNPDDLND